MAVTVTTRPFMREDAKDEAYDNAKSFVVDGKGNLLLLSTEDIPADEITEMISGTIRHAIAVYPAGDWGKAVRS